MSWYKKKKLLEFDKADFLKSLEETVTWCNKHAVISDAKNSLRQVFQEPLNEYVPEYGRVMPNYSKIVPQLIAERANILEKSNFQSNSVPLDLLGGRLFVSEPDNSLDDGMAEQESDGFIDGANVPVEDSWVYWFEGEVTPFDSNVGFIISYVPKIFIQKVQDGIDVNPEECVFWLEDMEHPIVKVMKELGCLFALRSD